MDQRLETYQKASDRLVFASVVVLTPAMKTGLEGLEPPTC